MTRFEKRQNQHALRMHIELTVVSDETFAAKDAIGQDFGLVCDTSDVVWVVRIGGDNALWQSLASEL